MKKKYRLYWSISKKGWWECYPAECKVERMPNGVLLPIQDFLEYAKA